MEKIFKIRSSNSYFDNRKSKSGPADENPKWLGLSVIAFVLVVTGAVAQAQNCRAKSSKASTSKVKARGANAITVLASPALRRRHGEG
jgi:hypothetical protein